MRTKTRSGTRSGGGAPSPGASKTRKLQVSEGVAIGALVALVLAEIVAFGASDVATAAVFGAVHAAYLLVLLATCRWARKIPGALTSIWPSLMFAALVVALAWSLTPFGPGGAHPVWRYLGAEGGSITVDRSSVLLSILRLIGLACLFLASQIVGASEVRRRALVWYLLLGLGAYAFLAIVDRVSLHASTRLTGTLLSPNSAATLMGVGLVFAVMFFSQALQRTGGSLRLERLGLDASLSLGVAAVFSVALALTASRAGIFSTVIGLAVLLTWQVIAQGRKIRAVVIVGGAAALLVVIGVAMRSADLTAARLENLGSDAASRQLIFNAHWEAFKASPWFGFGLGSFPVVNQLIMTTENLPVLFDVRATHNLYLQWLEEGGIVGSVFMVAWLLVALWRVGVEGVKAGTAGALARATIAATIAVLLHGLSDFAVQVPALQALFAVGLGAMTGAAPPSRRPGTRTVTPWASIAFACVTLVVSVLVAIPLAASRFGGDLSAMPTASAEVLATSIEAGLARNAADPAAKARLASLSRRELALRPGSGGAWLRKAAIDFQSGDITAGNEALAHSLAVAPLQTSLFVSRTRLAYENWPSLTPDLRQQVMYQVRIQYGRDGEAPLKALANSIRNPSGRIGLAFLIVAEHAAKVQ